MQGVRKGRQGHKQDLEMQDYAGKSADIRGGAFVFELAEVSSDGRGDLTGTHNGGEPTLLCFQLH